MARPVELYELVGRAAGLTCCQARTSNCPPPWTPFVPRFEIDPTYAPAHAGLARAGCVQAAFRAVPHQEAFAEAKASALRALAMDSASADAQVAVAPEWDSLRGDRRFAERLRSMALPSAAPVARTASSSQPLRCSFSKNNIEELGNTLGNNLA